MLNHMLLSGNRQVLTTCSTISLLAVQAQVMQDVVTQKMENGSIAQSRDLQTVSSRYLATICLSRINVAGYTKTRLMTLVCVAGPAPAANHKPRE